MSRFLFWKRHLILTKTKPKKNMNKSLSITRNNQELFTRNSQELFTRNNQELFAHKDQESQHTTQSSHN